MGNFYVNHTVKTDDVDRVVATLRQHGFTAYVSPVRNGCVVVAEEESDSQATKPIVKLGKLLSIGTQAKVLAVWNHDDDALLLALYERGEEVTDYSSSPDFIATDRTDAAGKAAKLCAAFGAVHAVQTVTEILDGASQRFVFAFKQHHALVEALGLSDFAVCHGYGDLTDWPDDASEWLKLPDARV